MHIGYLPRKSLNYLIAQGALKITGIFRHRNRDLKSELIASPKIRHLSKDYFNTR